MINLGNFRKGQIRGIDFSLAMIIFLLTMSQVLVLTTTFIENSQSSQDVSSDVNFTQAVSNSFVSTTGTYSNLGTNWENQTTTDLTTNGWVFGLADGFGNIDPLKAGRLASNSHGSYQLTYDEIRSATTVERDFSIMFQPTINATIIDVTEFSGSTLNVVGIVTSSGSGVEDIDVNLYNYDLNGVSQIQTTTNATGHFDAFIDPPLGVGEFHQIVAIATLGVGNQDMASFTYNPSSTVSTGSQSILPGTLSGYSVQVQAENTHGNASVIAFYVGFGSNITTTVGSVSGGTITGDIAIPQHTLVAVLTVDTDTSVSDYVVAVSSFPLINAGELLDPIGPTDPFGTKTTIYDQIVAIRGVTLRYSVTTWS